MYYILLSVNTIFCFGMVATATNLEGLLLQDPSFWPGHMEPFGSKQPTAEIEVRDSWPDPIAFFEEYVDENQPVLFKGLAKESPAYALFDDEYLMSFDGADTAEIFAEPEKKENRSKEGYSMSFKEFIQRYHNESLYLVHELPKQLGQHVRMPPPLRCDDTKKLLKMQVTWLSSGGTKSVLHNDNIDNINCLFRGSKQLWMIEYTKNKRYVPLDHPSGAYSSLDVEKVDYTKYPNLRKVDKYYYVDMQEGDCIFIPYLWFHQVNSVANENGQNLAVNIWFDHLLNHRPKKCDIPESKMTIDNYVFDADERNRVKEQERKELQQQQQKQEEQLKQQEEQQQQQQHQHQQKQQEQGQQQKQEEQLKQQEEQKQQQQQQQQQQQKQQEQGQQQEQEREGIPYELEVIHRFISKLKLKDRPVSIKEFLVLLIKHHQFNTHKVRIKGFPDEFYSIGEEFFKLIDMDEDGILTEEDLAMISSLPDDEYKTLTGTLEHHEAYVQIYFRDIFDERQKEKMRRASSATTPTETGEGKEEL